MIGNLILFTASNLLLKLDYLHRRDFKFLILKTLREKQLQGLEPRQEGISEHERALTHADTSKHTSNLTFVINRCIAAAAAGGCCSVHLISEGFGFFCFVFKKFITPKLGMVFFMTAHFNCSRC